MRGHACFSPRTHGSGPSHYSSEIQAVSSASHVYAPYMRVWDGEASGQPRPVCYSKNAFV